MKQFLSAHVVACLTRQTVTGLIERFQKESGEHVQHLHSWCDTMSGRMICHWMATDKEALLEWLEDRNVRIRGSSEWIMQVQFETGETNK